MLGLFLLAYLAAPVIILASSLGTGLLLWHLSGRRMAPVLIAPLGFAGLLAFGTFLTAFSFTARLNAVAMVVLGLAGLWVGRADVRAALGRARTLLAPGLAGLGAYLMMTIGPMSTGTASWTGYARITDLSQQFDWSAWLVTHGRQIPPVRDGGFLEVISKTAVTGYPGAGNAVFGSTAQLLGIQAAWTYQALMGVAVAMLALSVYGLLERAISSMALRGVAAFVSAQPAILFGYGLVGGIKEYTSAFGLVFCGALLGRLRPSEEGLRGMVPLAIGVSATIGSFSLTIGPWMAVLLVAAALLTILHRQVGSRLPSVDLRTLGIWLGAAVVIAAVSAPMLYWATQLAKVAVQAEGANATALIDLGNLSAPVAVRASLGAWISGDYRNPVLGDRSTTTLALLIIAGFALAGLVAAVRRRDRALLLLTLSTGVALLYYTQRTGPWIQLKAICLTGPIALALAFSGASSLGGWIRRRGVGRIVTVAGAAAIAAGVLAGNALALHDITLAPGARMRDLDTIGKEFKGQGPALYPAHEEYAEFFLRDLKVNALVNPGAAGVGPPQLRADVLAAAPQPSFAYDLDGFLGSYVDLYSLVVQRRGPLWSRPPADFELVRRSRFTDVWKRTTASPTVLWHAASPGGGSKWWGQDCALLYATARKHPNEDLRIAYAIRPQTVTAHLGDGELSRPWQRSTADTVLMNGPGSLEATFDLPTASRYRVWIQGPAQRPVTATIDGKPAGVLQDAWSYPQGWTLLSTRTLPAGKHTVRLARGGGRPIPGDGAGGYPIGPVVLENADDTEAATVRYAPMSQMRSVCSRLKDYDWVELVRR
jgi:hypothetical protein